MKHNLRNTLLMIQDILIFLFDSYEQLMIKIYVSQLILYFLALFKVPNIVINVTVYGN